MVQGLMGNYLEQSRQLFVQMQEQMTEAGGDAVPRLHRSPPKR